MRRRGVSRGRAERGFTAAGAWFSSLCALSVSVAIRSTAYPTRTLAAGLTRSGQTRKRPQRCHFVLAVEVVGDATNDRL